MVEAYRAEQRALEILKAVAKASSGAAPGLPAAIVRFTLEYRTLPDKSAEAIRLATLLEVAAVSLHPLDGQLPNFLILQFPNVKRTIAPASLFAAADLLVGSLDLVSCVPDIGSTVYAEPDARLVRDAAPESVITDLYCWSRAAAPPDPLWAPGAIKAPLAWTRPNGRGEGILVAQPDTGVATHSELLDSLALDKATNILDGSSDPTDPLRAGTANPGHGTATSSVVASREAGRMTGAAPRAKVIPIRCTQDVKIMDGAPIAKAILHAVTVEADIVTMSLGGLYSPSIAAALKLAIDKGLIVLAAAGNCVGFVVYPAADPHCIALAGIDVADKPWKGTSRGPQVDLSAPAENVYVARRTPGDGGAEEVSGGQGTSFAVALTAGVAALWLGHFGRTAVRKEAQQRGTTVQELFRAAAKATARRPDRWNSWLYGTGVVDAANLLSLELAKIPKDAATVEAAAAMPDALADRDVQDTFLQATLRATTDGFDWGRYGAEATYLAADAWRRSQAERAPLLEASSRPVPSPGMRATAPAILKRVLSRLDQAPALVSPVGDTPPKRNTIALLGRVPGVLESTNDAQANLESAAGRRQLQEMSEQALAALDADPASGAQGAAARRRVLDSADRVVRQLVTQGENSLRGDDRITLEALVRLKGRPAFKITDGALNRDLVQRSDWPGVLAPVMSAAAVKALSERVGRIDSDGTHVGTGFVVGPGIVMTNRHVAEGIADAVTTTSGETQWLMRDAITINFDDKGLGQKKRFVVKSIIATGPDAIGQRVQYSHLDMALLEVESTNGAQLALPKPMPLVGDSDVLTTKGRELAIVGYPARPDLSALEDPETHEFRTDVQSRLAEIFGIDYGRKYLAPGVVDLIAGKLDGDARQWIFTHDGTTLAGNSGSAVADLSDCFPIAGLHFAGRTLTANYGHSLTAVKASGILPALAGFRWV